MIHSQLANDGIDLVFVFFDILFAGHFANVFAIIEEEHLRYSLEGETCEEVSFFFNVYFVEAEFAFVLVICGEFFDFWMNSLANMAGFTLCTS